MPLIAKVTGNILQHVVGQKLLPRWAVSSAVAITHTLGKQGGLILTPRFRACLNTKALTFSDIGQT